MKKKIAILTILFFQTVIIGQSTKLLIIGNGQTDYKIVISRTISKWDSLAAKELKKYIKEISSVEISIVDDTSPIQEKEIVIGINNRSKNFEKEIGGLDEDGFVLRTMGDKLFIFGGNRKGALNGVYTFLEDYLGCRKYSATVKVIPKRKNISFDPINITQKPVFKYRGLNYLDAFDRDYNLWHKLDADEESRKIWGMFVHTFNKLVPPDKYFKKHPEYFAELNGIRTEEQLCLTNSEVFKIVVDDLRKRIKENPEAKIWSVSQNDNFSNCRCENCRAIDEREGSPSGSLLTFVNKVAAEFPDKIISTLAYQYTRSAPKTIIPAKNVNIVLCSIECNRSKPLDEDPNSKSFVDDLREWSKLTNNIMIWDYVVQFKNTMSPFPNFHVLQPNLQLFINYGAEMMFQQGAGSIKGSEFGALRTYIIAKLLWNPDADVEAIINDFLNDYYGSAGKYIREYIDLMHRELIKSKADLLIYGNPISPMTGYLSHELIDEYNSIFDRAENVVAKNTDFLDRVKIARLPLIYAMLEQAKVIRNSERGITTINENGKIEINKKITKLLGGYVNECNKHGKYFINESGVSVDEYKTTYEELISKTMYNPLALNKHVKILTEASAKYPTNGNETLTDGLRGINDYNFNWLGFEAEDLIAIIDLEKNSTIKKISADFLQDVNSWVFLPKYVEFQISNDGENYISVGLIQNSEPEEKWGAFLKTFSSSFNAAEARYVKVIAKNMKICPKWHKGYPGKAWIFNDEVVVE